MHQFSPLDAIMPSIFNALIVGWSCPEEGRDSLVSVLQRSLALVVEEWPDLAGEIVAPPADAPPRTQPTIRPVGELGSLLTIRDFTGFDSPFPHSYAQLQAQGFPTSKLDGQLLAPLAGVATTQRVMAAQANFIPGGCLLSVGFSHQFTDAYGVYLIFEKWAQYCRQVQGLPAQPAAFPHATSQPQTLPPPVLQVSHDHAAEQYSTLKHRPELWKLIGLDWRGSATSPPPEPPFQLAAGGAKTCIFSLSAAAQATLKRAASSLPSSSLPPISTNDALVAWIWRTISKARFPTGKPDAPYRDNSYVSVAIDGRRPLSIPADYAGNVVFCSMTNMPIHDLTNPETPLGEIAARIRQETIANRDPSRLKEAVTLAAGIPDVRQPLANAFPSWFAEDLVTTSWVGLPFYQLDFGPAVGSTGRIDTFRMPRGQFAGICSFQPRANDGSVEIVVGLLAEQMERLVANPDFAQFATLVSS